MILHTLTILASVLAYLRNLVSVRIHHEAMYETDCYYESDTVLSVYLWIIYSGFDLLYTRSFFHTHTVLEVVEVCDVLQQSHLMDTAASLWKKGRRGKKNAWCEIDDLNTSSINAAANVLCCDWWRIQAIHLSWLKKNKRELKIPLR